MPVINHEKAAFRRGERFVHDEMMRGCPAPLELVRVQVARELCWHEGIPPEDGARIVGIVRNRPEWSVERCMAAVVGRRYGKERQD